MLHHLAVIPNRETCTAAGCHAPPSERPVLGILDVEMSTERLQEVLRHGRRQVLWTAVSLLVITGLVTTGLVKRLVHRPVSRLRSGIDRIARGDLDARIDVSGRHELAELAEAFNRMAADLKAARQEVTEWSERLEEKVVEKTEELQRAQRQVLHMEKMASLGKLSATVAHELNNPLSGLLTYTRLVERELGRHELDPEARERLREYLGTMARECTRCGEIVKSLLLFSRRSAGGEEMAEVDLEEVLDRSLALIRHHLEISNVTLRREPFAGDPVLRADAGQLEQALVALFVNAVDVETAENATEALKKLQERRFDVALFDIKMPGMDGMELLEHVRRLDSDLAVIMITAFASVETAVQSLKVGAFDYVTKPVDPDELSHLVARALETRRLSKENVQLRGSIEELVGGDVIVGDSPQMQKVLELVHHVAGTDATVLIRGESGTGKELIARAIHANSPRRYFPIGPVNCGAVPETLLESELFGHERGAFTGAQYRRKGKVEMADGGSLFLDEVGAISSKMQVDLLRVLESKELTRVGGTRPVKVDFRVICATNEDLEKAVEAGRFREDFYYRINAFTIEIPPLRARRSDVQLLAEHFLRHFARQMDKRITEIAPEAMELLKAHDWPGNVRELANAVERATVYNKIKKYGLREEADAAEASAGSGRG